jgi:MFS family permease
MRRLLLFASAVVFVDTAFYAAITPLLPSYVDDLGLSKTGAGILAAAYPAGVLVGALPGGWVATRLGVKPTVLIGLGTLAVTSVAFGFGDSIIVLDTARFIQGVGAALSWAGAMGWLIGEAPRERRGELIGSAMGAAIVGALMGPVLGAAAGEVGHEPAFSSVAVAALVLMAWAVGMAARAPAPPPRLRDLARATRDPRIAGGMWLQTLPGLLFGVVSVLAPLRLDELGAGTVAIAACFLVAAALEATVTPIIGRVSDRRGRRLPAMLGLATAGTMMALLPWPQTAWLLAGLVVLASPAIGVLWAPGIAMLSDGAEAHGIEQAMAFALVNLGWAVGDSVGAAGGARLAEATSDHVAYLAMAAICAVTLALLSRRGPIPAPR